MKVQNAHLKLLEKATRKCSSGAQPKSVKISSNPIVPVASVAKGSAKATCSFTQLRLFLVAAGLGDAAFARFVQMGVDSVTRSLSVFQ